MRPTALLTAAVATLLLAAACGDGDAGERLPERSLAKLVLQAEDLPRSFSSFQDGRQVSSELSPVLEGDPARFDRQDGWVARFRRRGSARARGALTVASTVEVFARASGAQKYFVAVETRDADAGSSTGLTEADVPKIADQTRALTTAHAPAGSVRYVTVFWRDGRFVASLAASGFAGRITVADVVALVRRQEKRMAAVP